MAKKKERWRVETTDAEISSAILSLFGSREAAVEMSKFFHGISRLPKDSTGTNPHAP